MSPPALPPTFSDATPLVNGLALRRDPLTFFTRLAAEAGPFAHYQLPSGTVYFVNDPALIREVLVTQEGNFRKWEHNAGLRRIIGEGVLISEGDRYRRMQRIVRPAFRPQRLSDYARQMVELTRQRIKSWPDDGPLDLYHEMVLLTMDIVARTLLGVSLGDRLETVRTSTHRAQLLSDRLGVTPSDDRAFDDAVGSLHRVADFILDERRRQGQPDDDLLALLFHGQEDQPELVTDEQIHAEIRTFLVSGHITTANVIAAACGHLARDPGAADALREHLDETLGEKLPGLEHLPALEPCEHVLLETLRLHPPVWVLGRETLRATTLGGCTLPERAKLVIVPWVLHRDAQRFPEPDRFEPDRWRDDARSRLPRGSYIPFSAGPRSCLGERFAMLEGTLLLATIFKEWQFRQIPGEPDPVWSPQVILWPRRGIRLHASRRLAPTLSHR